jgi:hypothetical protein
MFMAAFRADGLGRLSAMIIDVAAFTSLARKNS